MLRSNPFPLAAAQEATVVDDAFRTLLILAVPVFGFVVTMLIFAIARFRVRGEPSQDGPPIRTHGPLVAGWFLVTIALTVFMIIHPGLTGMRELMARANEEVDLVVKVESMRFAWRITYPEQNITIFRKEMELVLPVDKNIRFEVTSLDVLHSFWVPAFRMKIDAVPGLITTTYATPDKVGSFRDDTGFRLQCAELCGVGHTTMAIPVRVVEQGEFDAWVAQQKR